MDQQTEVTQVLMDLRDSSREIAVELKRIRQYLEQQRLFARKLLLRLLIALPLAMLIPFAIVLLVGLIVGNK
jgi:hypothetical protein